MHCCIATPTTDSNTSTGMIWVTLNMSSAANCQGNARELSGNFTLSGEWSPWINTYITYLQSWIVFTCLCGGTAAKTARMLLMMVIPGQIFFMLAVKYLQPRNVDVEVNVNVAFAVVYLTTSFIQVTLLLLTYCIPIIMTALSVCLCMFR